MAENVKDLTVRLSFEHGDTKSQIAAIKNEIKLLDSGFKAAAAQAGGFSDSMSAGAAKATVMQKQLALQGEAVKKYGTALEQAQQRLLKATQRQEQYGQKIEATKAKNQALTDEIKQLKDAMAETAKATGENSDAYREMQGHLDELNKQLEDGKNELREYEAGFQRADKAIASADKSVQTLTIAQNEARTAEANLRTELDKLNSGLQKQKLSLADVGEKMEQYGEKVATAGKAVSKVGSTMSKGSAVIAAGAAAAVTAAVAWEDSFAGVRKTVDGTEEQLDSLEQALIDMGKVKPVDYSELAEIAANAGQLGIATENVEAFTAVMADMSATTDMSASDASSAMAQFANITGMAQSEFENMGSTVVELGNNMATTESKIVDMAQNIAAAGTQAGMTESQILAISAGMSSLGIEAAAGGTSFSKMISRMQVAVETENDELANFAKVANMSVADFKKAFANDAAGTFISFVDGLSSGGESAIVVLDQLGITETRLRDMLLRASNAGELMTDALGMADNAWKQNNALTKEAAVRYGTTASKLKMMKNDLQQTAMQFGEQLLPVLQEGMDVLKKVTEWFGNLDEATKKNIVKWAMVAAAAGPAVKAFGTLTTGIGNTMKVIGLLTPKISSVVTAASGLSSGLTALAGTAGFGALAVAAVAGTALLIDWASGAKQAREEAASMIETAKRMKEETAQTIYDTGTEDPLARFGLTKEGFRNSVDETQDWLDQLMSVWTDGKAETDDIVNEFVNAFVSGSDSVREKINARKSLLEGLDALDPETQAKLDSDLEQLEAYDREVAELLKKRQNGYITEDEQKRLDQVIKLRAELDISYGGEAAEGGYDAILKQLDSAIERTQSAEEELDPTIYGDALRALADGHKAYQESLDAEYDKQYAQVNLINDEATRMAALTALNEQYNKQRLDGEEAYNKAVSEAATKTWLADEEMYKEQIQLVDDIAAALAAGDTTKLAELTEGIDEGKLTSMLALVEQLSTSGTDETVLTQMGVDADDLKSKIQQIVDISNSDAAYSGLAAILGEAIPEEVQRILVGLDCTQAAEDWTAFMEGKDVIQTREELTAFVLMTDIDQAAVAAWEAQNAGVSLTLPPAHVGVQLGADWQKDVRDAYEQGKLQIYGEDDLMLEITPEVLERIDANDIVMLDEDGTIHVIITPEIGSTEAVQAALDELAPSEPVEVFGGARVDISTGGIFDRLVGYVDEYEAAVAKLMEIGGEEIELPDFSDIFAVDDWFRSASSNDESLQMSEVANAANVAAQQLNQLEAFDPTLLGDIATAVGNLMAVLESDEATADEKSAAVAQLEEIKSFIESSNEIFGYSGNFISQGIANGLLAYGWSGDAETLVSDIEGAINKAAGIASPAKDFMPAGGFMAAGIAEGLKDFDFTQSAANAVQSIVAKFDGIQPKGRLIGENFGKGLYNGLKSKMDETVRLARIYANRVTAAFERAWDEHSPSKVAEKLTWNFGRGLDKGMVDWPTVSERMLEEDINASRRSMAAMTTTNNDSRNQSININVPVDNVNVRDDADIRALAIEIASLAKRQQRGRGAR